MTSDLQTSLGVAWELQLRAHGSASDLQWFTTGDLPIRPSLASTTTFCYKKKRPRFYLADIKGHSWTRLTPFHVPDGSIVILTNLGSIPDKGKTISPQYLHCLWAHMNSYTMGVGNSLPGGSAAGAWSWSKYHPVPKLKRMELCLHSPTPSRICPVSVKYRSKFT